MIIIKNYKNNEVSVINYPLLDPGIEVKDYNKCFDLTYRSMDSWKVPIYIHIPFCSSICKFCIYSRELPDKEGRIVEEYVQALKREIRLYSETLYIQSLKIGAIFIGGGTPTCLSTSQIRELITTLKEYLPLEDVEITMECNVFSADEEKIGLLSELGVTRISTGVQTFNDKYRSGMGMKTSAEDVYNWIQMAKRYSFKTVSIDLLYGLPGQTLDEWKNDIKTGLSMPVNHFSIYKLAVFAYTKLYKELEQNAVPEIPEEDCIYQMYLSADNMLKNNNFTLQSCQEYSKKENDAKFWTLTYDGYGDNLSFGAFGFGYINGVSYQNIIDPKSYIEALKQNKAPIKMISQKITYEQLMERTIIFGFRRSFVEKDVFFEQYGKRIEDIFGLVLEELMDKGFVSDSGNEYRLTAKGQYYQGNISSEFMRSTFKNITPIKKKMSISRHIIPEAL